MDKVYTWLYFRDSECIDIAVFTTAELLRRHVLEFYESQSEEMVEGWEKMESDELCRLISNEMMAIIHIQESPVDRTYESWGVYALEDLPDDFRITEV